MRSLLFLSAAVSLAACEAGGQRTTEDNFAASDNQAASAPAAEAPTTTVPETVAIPAAFRGVYDKDEAACADPSEYRMEVRSDEIRFHESIGMVRKVTSLGPDRASVEADYQGEGESWTNVRELRLSDGGRTIAVSGEGTTIVRRFCQPLHAG